MVGISYGHLCFKKLCTLGADALSTKTLSKQASEARTVLATYPTTVRNKKQLDEIDAFERHLDEVLEMSEIGLLNRISKVYNGLRYEVLVYSDKIVWKVNDKKFNWNNHARLWGGELEFDINNVNQGLEKTQEKKEISFNILYN